MNVRHVVLAAFATVVALGAVGMPFAAQSAEQKPAAASAQARDAAVAVYTQEIIDAMDTDKNHEVSKAEFLAFMSREFDRLDVNHDGKLQQSEILNKPLMGQQKTSVSHR